MLKVFKSFPLVLCFHLLVNSWFVVLGILAFLLAMLSNAVLANRPFHHSSWSTRFFGHLLTRFSVLICTPTPSKEYKTFKLMIYTSFSSPMPVLRWSREIKINPRYREPGAAFKNGTRLNCCLCRPPEIWAPASVRLALKNSLSNDRRELALSPKFFH